MIARPYTLTIRFLSFIFAGMWLFSCNQPQQQQADTVENDNTAAIVFDIDAQQAFFDNLSSFCGKAFSGKQTYRSHHGASWAHLELVMHVKECEPGRLAIPFRVGDDRSRTWLFLAEEGRLRFRHDHRHEDGSPEDETLYGGYADSRGNALVQVFPADQYTADLIDGGGGNVWTVSISEDKSTFIYRLDRDGEKRFVIEFDLTNPLDPSSH